MNCPYCHGEAVKRGLFSGRKDPSRVSQSYQCKNCHKYFSVASQLKDTLTSNETIYEEDHDYINIVCASERCLTVEDVVRQFHIDQTIWEIESFRIKTSEGYRKDRQVDWHVTDGMVTQGDVQDSGKMLVVPLYHVQVKLKKRQSVAELKSIFEQLTRDAAAFAPQYPTIEYPEREAQHIYEIGLPDIHFGRLTWGPETGEDYDIKLATSAVQKTILDLLSRVQPQSIAEILLPVGNDFFNVNNKEETTSHGTKQQEDTRWQKTFTKGRELAVWMIDACSQVAPVRVIMVPGNHDEERSYYLGEVLTGWYAHHGRVSIDNSPMKRKYVLIEHLLIGYCHGYSEKLEKLAALMATEAPHEWGRSKWREFHLGDKHHNKELKFVTETSLGVTVRILPSLAPPDVWTFDHAFVGSPRAGTGLLYDPARGLLAQFTSFLDGR